jgi:hypothetical protein
VRPPAAIFALLATGCLIGCGSAHSHAKAAGNTARLGATGGHAAAPHAGSGGGAPSRAQARAFAGAVNLSGADVPGFKVIAEAHEHPNPAANRAKRELARCTGGLGRGRGTIELNSKSFERKIAVLDLHVSSQVSIAPTPADAARELGQLRSARVRGCLSRYLDLLFGASKLGHAFSGVSIAHGEPPAPGTTGTYGWRITSNLTVRGIKVPFYFDILGFVYGPAQVTLTSSGLIRPFPAAAQQQLFSLLVRRAESHRI